MHVGWKDLYVDLLSGTWMAGKHQLDVGRG
jgi:hypothetical protein